MTNIPVNLNKVEYTSNLFQFDGALDLVGHIESLRQRIIRSYRQGVSARANALLAEYVDEVLQCVQRGSKIYQGAQFTATLAEILNAQQAGNTVRIADLLEVEIPPVGLVAESVQVTEVGLSAVATQDNEAISFDLTAYAKGGVGDYEYKFVHRPNPQTTETLIQDYSRKNSCQFRIVPASEELQISVWVRCAKMAPRLDVESAALLRVFYSELTL